MPSAALTPMRHGRSISTVIGYDAEKSPAKPAQGDPMRRFEPPRLTRRAVLGGLVALPVFTSRTLATDTPPPSQAFLRSPPPITAADQVLNVMEFEALARRALPP